MKKNNKEAVCIDIRKFAELVSKVVSEELGGECQVKLQEVIKNNGVVLQGLVILSSRSNLSPTIYLNSYLEAYEKGVPLTAIVEQILAIYRQEMPQERVNLEFFREFEKVKDGICYKLINREKNHALLERIPHIDFLDLSICFFYAYRDEVLGNGSILIYNNHMDVWNCQTEALLKLAKENTPRIYPGKLVKMGELLGGYLGISGEELLDDIPMYVLSNEQRVFGAACMIYPESLEKAAEQLQENFYILPSSVHEVILLPKHVATDPEVIRDMVREINHTQVAPEEILSDNLYFYHYPTNHIELIKI